MPDIVTLGKPIGNGHPLGAVVTTPEVAASFLTGMEYFNTFGGNPVSAEIGLAVLDVIADERLQAHALAMGARLLAGLRGARLIVDVRGHGLFLGVELVRARARAAAIKEGLKARGVLISTDGPNDDVLKIKPPLVLSAPRTATASWRRCATCSSHRRRERRGDRVRDRAAAGFARRRGRDHRDDRAHPRARGGARRARRRGGPHGLGGRRAARRARRAGRRARQQRGDGPDGRRRRRTACSPS